MKYTKDEIDVINKLTLSNDILFNIVFRDEKLLSKQFIEILESNKLNSNIELVMQSEQRVNFNKKSILDMKLLNDNNCYIVEMQQSKRDFSVKRADLIIANTFSNLVSIGMNEDDYPIIRLHVLCTYNNFDNDDFKQVVKQSVLGKENYNYNSTIEVIYHNITSNKLPNNLYGDLCKYIYTGLLSDHKYIKDLDNKVKRVKTVVSNNL